MQRLYESTDYLHLKLPGGLKDRVRAVARLEHKNLVTVVKEFFLSYLAQKEPIELRQAYEREARLKGIITTKPLRVPKSPVASNGNGNGQAKPEPQAQPQA